MFTRDELSTILNAVELFRGHCDGLGMASVAEVCERVMDKARDEITRFDHFENVLIDFPQPNRLGSDEIWTEVHKCTGLPAAVTWLREQLGNEAVGDDGRIDPLYFCDY